VSSPTVVIRTPKDEYAISGVELEQFSLYTSYLVQKRGRWSGDFEPLVIEVEHSLQDLGVPSEILQQIATQGVVEVSIPYEAEEIGWAARILPWEFVLTAATRRHRKGPLLVVRHLNVSNPPPKRAPASLLFVQNGGVGGYSFESERRVVESSLEIQRLETAVNPTRAELQGRVQGEHPDIIHLSGVDLHQGRALLAITPDADERRWDGLYLSDALGAPDAVEAEALAEIINPAGAAHRPVLVSCNFYHSAARVAAMMVAHGSAAAIGFQDEFEDTLAERFFGEFYRLWQAYDWDLLMAFQQSLHKMSGPQLRGTGVVLWSALPLVREARNTMSVDFVKRRRAERRQPIEQFGTGDGTAAPGVSRAGPKGGGTSGGDTKAPTPGGGATPGPGTGTGSLKELFAVSLKPPRQINYSLLHNRERLFDAFAITRLRPGYVRGISILVELYVGSETFPYRRSVDLTGESDSIDLVDTIHVPLLSTFLRSNREAVNTSLYVEVKYAGEDLWRETFPVSLLAVDEWKFDPNEDSRWLASFVLPRDPAVLKIVAAAQRYVTALRDDAGAGFDGYQSVDPEAEDPDAAVDLQVRALWSALIQEFSLTYINPPPTFTENSQRLRTPSDVINARHGTCIDLALLFAACLELVEIHPVIFVLKDHAFPGYWRNAEAHENFLRGAAAMSVGKLAAAQQKRSLDEYDEVMQVVNHGDLVPLETVWLTQRKSFQEAVDAGMENLINRSDFGALLDLQRARVAGVTPLPIMGGNG
jgi:hypothetical protein